MTHARSLSAPTFLQPAPCATDSPPPAALVFDDAPENPRGQNLVADLRAILYAKQTRALEQPLIAAIDRVASGLGPAPELLALLGQTGEPRAEGGLALAPDGPVMLRVSIDYDDAWRDGEKEVRDLFTSALEAPLVFLTDEQAALLKHSPREFLALRPPPETAELVDFQVEPSDRRSRVIGVTVAQAPARLPHARHVAIVPNLVALQRQESAIAQIEAAGEDSPLLPLRVLLGLSGQAALDTYVARSSRVSKSQTYGQRRTRLDEFQQDCVAKALSTPHFAVIEGPPGSGKTGVIAEIARELLSRGERVLVVSPTHVAVDNVVQRLVKDAGDDDDLSPHTLPVRYAARLTKSSGAASAYWVGAKRQKRGAAIGKRLQTCLTNTLPLARRLFEHLDENESGHAPLSSALARVDAVLCGTPIGLLSHESVKAAPPGAFDTLIVDEISKLTLPEFLAVAVKARRWILVGDPAQLAPFNKGVESGCCLNDVLSPALELACSVTALLVKGGPRRPVTPPLIVVAADPASAVSAIRHQVDAGFAPRHVRVGLADEPSAAVIVCSSEEVAQVWDREERSRLAKGARASSDPPRVLVERGLARPTMGAPIACFVELGARAQASLFDGCFAWLHAERWSRRSGHGLRLLEQHKWLEACIPAKDTVPSLHPERGEVASEDARRALLAKLGLRFALCSLSAFDWLVGTPADSTSAVLAARGAIAESPIVGATRPYVGRLRKQYRMHPSLSVVPRDLFYFGEALQDGRGELDGCNNVVLRHVERSGGDGETNEDEVRAIVSTLQQAIGTVSSPEMRRAVGSVLVLTPYREQEARLRAVVERTEGLSAAAIEVATLDRCQGREADTVLISLVQGRASTFLDLPNRWNVALTRARKSLVLVGNIDAYLGAEADNRSTFRREEGGSSPPPISLLSRAIRAYARQGATVVRGVAS